jgi:hypothetical protein
VKCLSRENAHETIMWYEAYLISLGHSDVTVSHPKVNQNGSSLMDRIKGKVPMYCSVTFKHSDGRDLSRIFQWKEDI